MTRLTTPEPSRCSSPTARAIALVRLTFERPDLDLAERFLVDFGLVVAERGPDFSLFRAAGEGPACYLVRRGVRPRFVGHAFAVATEVELEQLARLPGATEVESALEPLSGRRVRLIDPSGFEVEASFGADVLPPLPTRRPLDLNVNGRTPRVNAVQRLPAGPSAVLRLGHVVLELADFQATCGWYTKHFGLIPSDVQVLPDGSPAVAFLRLDRGDTPTDHHTLALAQSIVPAFAHAAFETVDPDAVGMGGETLRRAGWIHAWGVGRHILGSQVFDYWEDPFGDKHEHYADGDLFTSDQPTGIHPVSREAMAQWGPPMPASFTKPKPSLALAAGLVESLRKSPDVTLDKVRTLARIFG